MGETKNKCDGKNRGVRRGGIRRGGVRRKAACALVGGKGGAGNRGDGYE